ncbi:MAG: ATP-binding protein [Candidatus Omnitrophota bacterium]
MPEELFLFKSQKPELNLTDGSEMLNDFSLEGQRHLISARNSLLVLDTIPSDKEAIENIFKTFHTLSGLADFLQLHDIYWVTKTAEMVMDLVRKKMLPFEGKVYDLILMALKRLQELFELLDEQIEHGGQLRSPYPDQEKLVLQLYHLSHTPQKSLEKVKTNYADKDLPLLSVDDGKAFYEQLKKKIHSVQGNIVMRKEPLERLLDDFKELDSELRNAQKKVQERQKELIQERELALKLTQKSKDEARSKSEYLANMSHEIRTLINAILGFTDLIKGDLPENSKQAEHLNTVILSGRMLLEIVNNILDFSKVEAGRLALEEIPLNLREIIEDVFKVIRARLDRKPINLYIDIGPDIPINLKGDPTRLKQIFLNLLDNAVKFTEKGEIGISINLSPSPQQDQAKKTWLLFTVKDSGIGIPAERIECIFDSFTQAETSTTRLYGGSGLGLALCKAFVEAMGGKLWTKSNLGEGTEMVFTIGFNESSMPVAQPLKESSVASNKVLLITPFDTSVKMFNQVFEFLSMVPLSFSKNIKHASEVLSALKHPPDFIFIDMIADGQGLLKFANEIKKQNLFRGTKLIAVSSDIKCGESLLGEGSPYEAMILTPVILKEFIGTVLKLSSGARGQAEKKVGIEEDLSIYRHLKVLVVEDSVPNQELLRVHFETLGCYCDYASNGKEAVEYLQRMEYDLCFMDLQMPVMGGLEAAKFIRSDLNLKLPIIALTAAEIQEEREKCLAAGMNDYLPKPFDVDQLKQKMKNFITKQNGVMR